MLRKSIARAVASGVLALSGLGHCAEAPINALWNDDDGFGIWLYGRPGSCSQFRYKNPPFVVLGNAGKRSEFKEDLFDVSRLKVCLRATPPDVAFCTSGTVRTRYEPASDEYVGEYDINLSDNTTWSGRFRAQHCKLP
ncbi:MAG: hypothetical protein ACXWJM_01050 [Ramlibacter sp.]